LIENGELIDESLNLQSSKKSTEESFALPQQLCRQV